ncbi:hypothetical protein [Phaeobacter inhibens]|uniref:hypothetical protein n=1 Tax=Phaeobacter inhibens TaxID=221822 RepID=UPI0021A929E4|nr:hypothetical protein [Phaeobacter inhibens]UWR47958.1 hypothetical protein K4F87_11510 [Phaeobacter inhibens]
MRTAFQIEMTLMRTDSVHKGAVAGRTLLRALSLWLNADDNLPSEVRLSALRAVLTINASASGYLRYDERYGELFFDYETTAENIQIYVSTSAVEFDIKHTPSVEFYHFSWETEDGTGGGHVALENPDAASFPLHVIDHGNLASDASILRWSANPTEIFNNPLWSDPPNHLRSEFPRLLELLSGVGEGSRFWQAWYQGFLDGNPLDWELQRRVALINDDVWDAGPEAVAVEIERIRSLFELEQEIANLKGQLTAVQNTPAAALIGDNGGPPLKDAPARAFQTDLALIWKQVEELEEEIAKPSPSLSHLEKIAKALWDISLRMAAYCGSIADGMIREGSKELAKAGAKWTARATAVTVTAQTEGVQSVVKAIGAFVKTLQ